MPVGLLQGSLSSWWFHEHTLNMPGWWWSDLDDKDHFGCSGREDQLMSVSDVKWQYCLKKGKDVWGHLPDLWCCPWRKVSWITVTFLSWRQALELLVSPWWLIVLGLCVFVTTLNYWGDQWCSLGTCWFLVGVEGNLLMEVVFREACVIKGPTGTSAVTGNRLVYFD